MDVDQQQSINNGTTRDNVIQLLNILKQRNLGNKIDEEEASKLVSDIINASKNDAVKLRRSKRGLMKEVKKGYRWLRRSIQQLNTQENRELIKEGSPWLHRLVHQPNRNESEELSENLVEEILDILDALDPFRDVGDIVRLLNESSKEQFTETQQVTEVSQTTEGQQVTTKMPRVTDGKCSADRHRYISLHSAAALGDLGMVKYFVEKERTYVSDKNIDGDTPLHLAAGCGHLDVVEYLVGKRAYIYSKNNSGYTPLHAAAGNGQLDVVKYLVEEETDLMAVKSGYGFTPLYVAAGNGHLDVVKYLVEKGANLDDRDVYGDAPIHKAIQKGQLDVVKYLIESVVDINIREGHCNRALRSSAMYGNLDMMKYLIENGTDINAKDSYGNTALHNAANNGRLDVVRYLVEQGADVNAKTDYNETPLDFAKSSGKSQVVEFLSSYQHGSRGRRDVSNNSWMNNGVINWVKGLISSTEFPALLTSREHNHTVKAVPEINTTVVNNTIMLGILASGLFNKTQHKQPIHENLLSPREQSMRLNNLDRAERAIWDIEQSPSTYVDEVLLRGNNTGWQK